MYGGPPAWWREVWLRRRRAASERALDAFETELAGLTEPARETRDAVCACVSRLAATLKPEYREALQQVEIEGASVKDYAAAAGISASNAWPLTISKAP